jgi:uncharacterized membrane protein YfcA
MRQFLATVAGLASGVFVIMLIQFLGDQIVRVEISATTPEEFIKAVKNLPPKAFIPVAISHAFGALLGMIISRRITKKTIAPLVYVGAILTLLTLVNLLSFPHPIWFWVLDLGLISITSIAYITTRKKA